MIFIKICIPASLAMDLLDCSHPLDDLLIMFSEMTHRIVELERIRLQDRCLALCMASHPRLGGCAPEGLSRLPQDVILALVHS